MSIPVPKNLQYMPFQEEGIEFARERKSVLIADAPGLGKTIQAIGYLNCHWEVEKVLVVCPATMKNVWARELDKWLISPCVEVKIINYDILQKLDMKASWDAVIFDEIHYCKSRTAKRSKLGRAIKAKVKIGLSGTPLLNRPVEIWHILHMLDPGQWPMDSYNRFVVRYCNAHQGRFGWDVTGASHLDELREKLKPLMIRRLKEDVLKDLPAKRYQIIELPTAGLGKDLIEKLRVAKEKIAEIEETYKHDVQKLRSKVSAEWMEMAALRHEAGRAKVPMAVDVITDAVESGEKVVVFAHHRDVIEALQVALRGFNPVVLHGGTPQHLRTEAVDRFQGKDHVKVFIGQIQAAGVGITLTASSHVIFVEIDWTPGIMEQAADRVHRIGQKESVLIQHLVLEGSLDAHMAKGLVRKQSVIDKALGNNSTTEEW
jgi:SWI/SNF-related matrix-associated actin-dependent regulator 1 of chromatin subfamily A